MKYLIVGLALVLAGCETVPKEPRVVTRDVLVPVVRSCVPKDIPEPGAYADDVPGKDAAERFQKAAGANQQRKARLAILEPILKVCR